MKSTITIGSVCSGIEAATVAWEPFGVDIKWFSEIATFPSEVLETKYPNVPNYGDMQNLPSMISKCEIEAPDLICGGTPCQAFSLAGWKQGLEDQRGNLTLSFIDIIEANDAIRFKNNQKKTIIFWENVEGVLTDKTNAFGVFISSLAGLNDVKTLHKWPLAGLLRGPVRNVAWRVLDAKYFGLPQQRRRLYLLAGGKDFYPENVLFDISNNHDVEYPDQELTFVKNGVAYETFREYTDCLYSSYGTKWNGNAAAYNGSLYVVQDDKIRRLSPLECERLMGFPDDYTNIPTATRTTRYQALGNSWAVPVIHWIGKRLFLKETRENFEIKKKHKLNILDSLDDHEYYDLSEAYSYLVSDNLYLNASVIPNDYVFGNMKDIVDCNPPKEIYISPVGSHGIIRRKDERNLSMNERLEMILRRTAEKMPIEKINKISRVQKRGRFSEGKKESQEKEDTQFVQITQMTFDDLF